MRRALFAITMLFVAGVFSLPAWAQRLDPMAPLKDYVAKVLPRCPGSTLTVEPLPSGPANFNTFSVTHRSTDKYCGSQKYLLFSPRTQQILVGSILSLPNDDRPANVRVAEQAGESLGHPTTATISPFPLPDGLKSVNISRQTPFGPFVYHGFLDASGQFLIVGFRGALSDNPGNDLRESLGAAKAARRGNRSSNVEILELSDFECPTCANAHKKVEPLIRQNLGRISYVRIDLPLFEHHEWSLAAAMGARAILAVAPDKYWDYVDYVFTNQDEIGKQPIDHVIKDYCEDHDIKWAAVEKIYSSASERQDLLDQVSRAFSIGIASTPTYIINGQIMGFGPDGAFTMDAIRNAIASSHVPAKKATPKKIAPTKKATPSKKGKK